MNSPSKKKYGFWTNNTLPKSPDEWLKGAKENEGSWWPNWLEWNKAFAGEKVAARKPGSAKHKPIEDAPGTYVKVQN